MPKFADHECHLLRQEEDIVKQFIDTGVFIFLRRRIRSCCMISRKHPDTARYFKSNAACRNEEVRHLVHNYFMVHPFSMFNLYWEFFVFCIYCLQYILIPIDAFRSTDMKSNIFIIKLLLDILQLTDIVKLFYTGYYDQGQSKVILDYSKVARRYTSTYFLVDVLSSSTSYLYPFVAVGLFNIPDEHYFVLRLLNRVQICRLPRWLTILNLFRRYMDYSSYLIKGIRVVLIFLVLTFWAFSIHYLLETHLYGDLLLSGKLKVFKSYYDATMMLLLVNFGKEDIKHIIEYVNAILFFCFGFALQLFIYAQILQVWTKYASAENKHYALHKQFKEYMKYKELPVSLRKRIFAYFQFKFHKQFFKESDINNMVSPLLKQEILLHVTRNHIERVEFFRHLPEDILTKVVAQLKSEVFLPGDVIIKAGTIGTSMFFIFHGTVAVYTPSGKEICHLEDGAHFGEIALIISETRVATVVAVSASELFMLRRSDFLAAIEPFPQFRDQLIALATERLRKTISQSD